MHFPDLCTSIGHEVEDAEEEAFLLFSQDIPSQNLGFLDSQSQTVEISVLNRDLTIHQSPSVLSSKRAGGTTGAVLWMITPLFAQWLCSPNNILWESSTLHDHSSVIELGCGVSGVLALSLGPSVGQYTATDQEYVRKLFQENLDENYQAVQYRLIQKGSTHDHQHHSHSSAGHKSRHKSNHGVSARRSPAQSQSRSRSRNHAARSNESSQSPASRASSERNIIFTPLDWETDALSNLQGASKVGFDLLLACDCIYNDALVEPFVQTCADIARLRPSIAAYKSMSEGRENEDYQDVKPTICIIAQQLRSHEVFESWLQEALEEFVVWRVKDEIVGSAGLGTGSGYAVHVLVLRE